MKNKEVRKCVKWVLPSKGRLKLNFDGSSRCNTGLSGVGFIVRNDSGGVVWGASCKIIDGNNNEVELSSLYEGLKYYADNNLHHIDIEGKSQGVIRVVNMNNAPS